MSIFKRPGSSFYKYEFIIDGQRYQGSTKRSRKSEAQAVEEKVRKDILDGLQLGIKAHITLGAAVDRYLSTIKHQADHVKQEGRARKLFGEEKSSGASIRSGRWGLSRTLPLASLDNTKVSELVEARLAEGNKPRTINLEIALLQRVWNVARKKWGVRVSMNVDWSEHKFKVRGIPRPLTSEECDKLLTELAPENALLRLPAVWRHQDLRLRRVQDAYDFVVFLLDTGMRHDEAARLMWDKIDLGRGVISVFRPKVRKESLIGISARLRAVLERRKECKRGPWVFTNDGGTGPRPYSTSRSIAAAMDRAGINDPDKVARYGRRTVHQLRDTFATRVGRRVGIQGIQRLLGHTSVRTSEKYTDLIDDRIAAEAAEALNVS